MTEIWADYSGGRPGGAALKAAGFTGVIRYVGEGSTGKRLTVAEAQDLAAHGLRVRCVVENTTTDANGGYNAGIAAAHAALNDPAVAAANPEFIYAANDQPGWNQTDVQYVQGFTSVLGNKGGAYGFGAFLAAVKAAIPDIGSLWQAGPAPSRTGTESIANLWQRNGTPGSAVDGPATPTAVTVNGIECDVNNRINEETTMDEQSIAAAVWAYKLGTPTLDPNSGQYTGDQMDTTQNPPVPVGTSTADFLRFVNSVGWWVVAALRDKVLPEMSADQAAVLAAIQGVQAGAVDVAQLAQALVPLLAPQDATALVAALKAQFDK